MLAWKTVFLLAGFLAGIGASIDKLIPLRHKTRLHDKMVRWWIRLDETPMPDYARLLSIWIVSRLDHVMRRHYLRTIIFCFIASFFFISLASFWSALVAAPDPRMFTGEMTFDPTKIYPSTWFDSVPLPHVLVVLSVVPYDLLLVLSTIIALRIIRSSPPFWILLIVPAQIAISIVCAIFCMATIAHVDSYTINHDLVGAQYERRLREFVEPTIISNIMANPRLAGIRILGKNESVMAFVETMSTNINTTHYEITSSFIDDLHQSHTNLWALVKGQRPMWEGKLNVNLQDKQSSLSYTRTFGTPTNKTSFLLVGSVFYPSVTILILLSTMFVAKVVLTLGRTCGMFYFDRATENTPYTFIPGTLLGIVSGIVLALLNLVSELITLFHNSPKF